MAQQHTGVGDEDRRVVGVSIKFSNKLFRKESRQKDWNKDVQECIQGGSWK